MQITYWDTKTPFPSEIPGRVVTIGNFDGVHRGHRLLLDETLKLSRDLKQPALAITFDPLPLAVLKPEMPLALLTNIQKRTILLAKYMDVLVIKTTSHFLQVSAEDFLERILYADLNIAGLVEGPDFRFGMARRGTVSLLEPWARKHHIELRVVPSLIEDQGKISSSSIRQAIQQGKVALASRWLGRPYCITGLVSKGAMRGKTLGFPTANLTAIETLIPQPGIYAVTAKLFSQKFIGACNIGPNPTFGESDSKVEVHFLGMNGDLYGQKVEIEFMERIRDVRKFESKEVLVKQIQQDIETITAWAKTREPGWTL